MKRFEDTLWQRLEADHGPTLAQLPAPRRRVATTGRIAIVTGVAAVIAGGLVVGPSMFGGSPPAYAVEPQPDGSVLVTLHEMAAAEQATAELRRLGVRAVVVPQLPPDQCPTRPSDGIPHSAADLYGDSVRILPSRIPPEANLVLSYQDYDGATSVLTLDAQPGPPPTCTQLPNLMVSPQPAP